MCLSPEKMIITCFSEGDEVVFSLTLNDVLLVQTRGQSQCQRHWSSNVQPLSFNDSQNKINCINFMLDLHKQPIGQVICHVWNNVSQNDAFIQLTLCKGTVMFSVFPEYYFTLITNFQRLAQSNQLMGIVSLKNKLSPFFFYIVTLTLYFCSYRFVFCPRCRCGCDSNYYYHCSICAPLLGCKTSSAQIKTGRC